MRIYNTATRKIEEFRPQSDEVKMYTCGPTVYSRAHIGNLLAYVYWDLLERVLKENHYKVKRVMNITDVGHLSSDRDEGEDKMEKGARKHGKTVFEVAEEYTQAFLADMRALNWLEPTRIMKATDCIEESLELVQRLIDKGVTYETTDGIYFDTSQFASYADFAQLDLAHLKAGARVAFNKEKRNVSDFAIWKWVLAGQNHAMQWEFQGKMGYPGWHLECATIIHKTLGQPIDIHTGGIDHIPIHHTNEIAEAEVAYGKKLANYWLHCNHLRSEGRKLSKSLGNGYTLSDLAEKGFTAMDFRMWSLMGHYQAERNFSLVNLQSAHERLKNYQNWAVLRFQEAVAPQAALDEVKSRIMACLNENLNTAAALSVLDEALKILVPTTEFIKFLDRIFGLRLMDLKDIAPHLKTKIVLREQAKLSKDYAYADQLRSEIEALAEGKIKLLDTKTKTIWTIA